MPSQPHLNEVLKDLAPDEADHVLRQTERIHLPLGCELHGQGSPIDHMYFMESGVTSLLHDVDGSLAEVGMIGREGAVGYALAFGLSVSPHRALVQIPGFGLRLPAERFPALMAEIPRLGEIVRANLLHLFFQVSETAYANARVIAHRRLARWLLMCHDRADGPNIPLTHEYLATMLGTGRGAVTLGIQALEGEGFIKGTRGNIRILDRHGLLALVGGIYSPPKRVH
ncbi:MAG: Crp/Fnr family transcriptional regulator [Phreatobacter sp.]|jgi:CRP-like cAMP-binding protein|uniref:Crp/Fnr family transcriptional regulator n=1 Tax=Phreatobacter sp. TaxID=1966341 RepID=UPI0040357D7A